MKNNPTKNIIIAILMLLVFAILYIVIDRITNKEKDEYGEFLKNYEVNEYIPTYVSDEEMAEIYLNDYIHTMYSNIERAYELIDREYKDKKFVTIDDYKNYVYSLNYATYQMDRYYVKNSDGYKIFGVYDTNGNIFIFKTKGVMQYTVYLDDYTVEI